MKEKSARKATIILMDQFWVEMVDLTRSIASSNRDNAVIDVMSKQRARIIVEKMNRADVSGVLEKLDD